MMPPDLKLEIVSAEQTYRLRQTVLGWRIPGLPLDGNRHSRHFIIHVSDDLVVGCASCGPSECPEPSLKNHGAFRFWGAAVLHPFQGRGHGTRLLAEVIREAKEQEAGLLWANARESAVPFYLQKGFRVVGGQFVDILSGLTDRRVVLDLTQSTFDSSPGSPNP